MPVMTQKETAVPLLIRLGTPCGKPGERVEELEDLEQEYPYDPEIQRSGGLEPCAKRCITWISTGKGDKAERRIDPA